MHSHDCNSQFWNPYSPSYPSTNGNWGREWFGHQSAVLPSICRLWRYPSIKAAIEIPVNLMLHAMLVWSRDHRCSADLKEMICWTMNHATPIQFLSFESVCESWSYLLRNFPWRVERTKMSQISIGYQLVIIFKKYINGFSPMSSLIFRKKTKTDEQNYLPKNHSKSVIKLISHNWWSLDFCCEYR